MSFNYLSKESHQSAGSYLRLFSKAKYYSYYDPSQRSCLHLYASLFCNVLLLGPQKLFRAQLRRNKILDFSPKTQREDLLRLLSVHESGPCNYVSILKKYVNTIKMHFTTKSLSTGSTKKYLNIYFS